MSEDHYVMVWPCLAVPPTKYRILTVITTLMHRCYRLYVRIESILRKVIIPGVC